MLPIVQRELRVVSRNRSLYRGRYRIALLAALFAMAILVFGRPGRSGGGTLFMGLTTMVLFFVLLEGVRKTSDSISEEKREGTLGFLFLTDLKGHDVILGKLAASSLRSFQGLLAFLPVLSITLLLGGITLGEFWRTSVVLVNSLFVSLAVGIGVSSVSRERGTLATALVLLGWAAVGLVGKGWSFLGLNTLADLLMNFSPFTALINATEMGLPRNRAFFWLGMLGANLLGWAFIALASYVVPRVWQDKEVKQASRSQLRTIGGPIVRARKRAELLETNPILWLAYNEKGDRRFKRVFYSIGGLMLLLVLANGFRRWDGVIMVTSFILNLLLWLGLASESSRTLADARRNGALELMLSTPLRTSEIVDGIWLALRKTFLVPGLVLFSLYLVVMFYSFFAGGGAGVAFYAGKAAVNMVIGCFAGAWFGMLMGLTQKSRNRALFKTIMWTIVMPMVVFCLPNIILLVPIMAVAKDKLTAQMRRLAADRHYAPFAPLGGTPKAYDL